MWNFHLYDGLFNKNGSDEEENKINLINYLEKYITKSNVELYKKQNYKENLENKKKKR